MSNNTHQRKKILEVKSLKKYYPIEKGFLKKVVGHVKAIDDISFYIYEGETLGLVGETGCGKTTTGLSVIRGIEPTEGNVMFDLEEKGMVDITKIDKKELRKYRKEAQIIFQDPYSSLDPRMSVLDIISEPLILNKLMKGKELEDRVKYLMGVVGLDIKYLKRYPFAFSGGQRQRISIARALAMNPRFIVADEPTSALDVSIQAQILNLMQDLQEQFKLTYLFISHNLSVIEHMSHRVGIMYLGRLVEIGRKEDIFSAPKHPYTESLLKSIPVADPHIVSGLESAQGEIGNPANPPSGCHFHPRCSYAEKVCSKEIPKLTKVGEDHFVACHLCESLKLKGGI